MTSAVEPVPRRSVPGGTILLLALAGGLYTWLMTVLIGPVGGGAEDSLGQALELLFLTTFLWLTLAILLLVGGVMGEMPRWAAILAGIAHPLSGIGAFLAMDMASHHAEWALVVPLAVPLLLSFYAAYSRFPALRARFPAPATGIAVWSAVLLLSIVPFAVAYW